MMTTVVLQLIYTFLIGYLCNHHCETHAFNEYDKINQKELLSFAMANTVITKSDSLIWYKPLPKPKWTYDLAFLGQALDKLGHIDIKFSNYGKDYIDYFVNDDGIISGYKFQDYNLDNINPGKLLFIHYKRTGDNKYKIAIDKLFSQILKQPKTNSGGFWHKQRYPYQMWLDGVYMSSPFIVEYASVFNKPMYFDLATNQIKHIYQKTIDPNTGLLYHAWDESKKQLWCNSNTGQSKHFWSRAMGWYAMAIVDVLDFLPENHKDRSDIILILNNVVEALLKVDDQKLGLWYQVLDRGGDEGNYIETSGSAMFIYVLAKAAKKGYLPSSYFDLANTKFNSLVKTSLHTDNKGFITLTNIVGGCGLGGNPYREGDYKYYINEKRIDNDPKGVAPFILAAVELNR